MARLNLLSNSAHLPFLWQRGTIDAVSTKSDQYLGLGHMHVCLGFLKKFLLEVDYHLNISSFSGNPNEFKDNTSFWKLNLETLISLEREKLSKAPTITSITPYQFLFFAVTEREHVPQ